MEMLQKFEFYERLFWMKIELELDFNVHAFCKLECLFSVLLQEKLMLPYTYSFSRTIAFFKYYFRRMNHNRVIDKNCHGVSLSIF